MSNLFIWLPRFIDIISETRYDNILYGKSVRQYIKKVRETAEKKYFLQSRRILSFLAKVQNSTGIYAKDNPDGFLSYYLALRNLWFRGVIDKLEYLTI